jgi:hypothetical protein
MPSPRSVLSATKNLHSDWEVLIALLGAPNRAGNIAAQWVINAPPDGYTILSVAVFDYDLLAKIA